MADILQQVYINASPDKVYAAISTEEGLKSWWTADTEAESHVGSVAVFGFYNRATVFRLKIDESTPSDKIRWRCFDRPDEWKGTKLALDLKENPDGETILNFTHSGWESTDGPYPYCNTTWGTPMTRLNDYLEGKNPGPFFNE